jgi:GH24 family phage-related lysozyme (muramidase)
MQWKSISCRYLRTPMMRFESGPKDKPRCPDGGALEAYQCAAGKWTIAFGVRWHPDGRVVKQGDKIRPDQVWEYTDAAVARVEADIRSVITIEMLPHQYAGVVFWVYNLGIQALKNTVDGETKLLPKINAGRWMDAASAMGVFVYSTTVKDGKPWKRALFGLFIRRCAEGCLLMGCDWEYACDQERLSLPTRTDWQPSAGRFYDVVLDGKTPFLNVYRDAQNHPLTVNATITIITDKPAEIEAPLKEELILADKLPPSPELATSEVAVRETVETSQPLPSPPASEIKTEPNSAGRVEYPARADAPEPEIVAPRPPVQAPLPLPTPPKPPVIIAPKSVDVKSIPYGEVAPENGAKNMSESQRVIGMVIVGVGSVIQVVTTRLGVGGVIGAVTFDLSRDPVVVALLATGVVVAIGFFTRKRGTKVVTNGMVNATQLLK